MNRPKKLFWKQWSAIVTGFLLLVTYNNCSGGFSSSEPASQQASGQGENGGGSVPGPTPNPNPIPSAPSGDYNPGDGPQAPGTQIVNVRNSQEFLNALAIAKPGDEITLADGTYDINTDKVRVNRSGTAASSIFVRALNPQKAVIRLCTSAGDGFYVANAGFWVFENLHIDNGCENTTDHAFHIVGGTNHFIIRKNLITNFRSHVKVNGEGTPRLYPDSLWFIGNVWKLTRELSVKAVPHNVLNVDGGHNMVIRGNVFVDHLRTGGSSSSIYVKMGTADFLVEQNLVVCQKHLSRTGYSPRGIYSGDAGSAPNPLCENDDCFNRRGLYRNNIVMNCNGDGNVSGLQVRLEKETKYLHNTIHTVKNNFMFDDPAPIDVSLYSNIMEKPFTFQGATRPSQYLNNLEQGAAGTSSLWNNPAIADFSLKDGSLIRSKVPRRTEAPHDFCGNLRAEVTDLGAIDYSNPAKAAECVQRIKALYQAL